jgi:hypothetical protein
MINDPLIEEINAAYRRLSSATEELVLGSNHWTPFKSASPEWH